MKRYAVIGASSGTGLEVVRQLAEQGNMVRAISRHPPESGNGIESVAADVTDAHSIADALDGEFDAVFFTVDIHGMFKPRAEIRSTMYQGCVNVINAAAKLDSPPKFVLLSVMGPDQSSWVWWVLNGMKPGMQTNILDREQALKDSGLPYVICRAPKLDDTASGIVPIVASAKQHRLNMSRGIARGDLARAMILAAEQAPQNSTWDIFASQGEGVLEPGAQWLPSLPSS